MRTGTPGFVKERLRQAREVRGLSVAVLAEAAGVSRQAIYQYEAGSHSPSSEVLERFGNVLAVPIHNFLKPVRETARSAVYFRSMSSATKAARVRANRLLERVEEVAYEVSELADLPAVDIPDLGVPDDPVGLGFDDIEELAVQLRRAWGLGDGPISNLTWLLENHGIVVARVAIEARTLDALSCWIDGRPYLLVNDDLPLARSRFDLAHELAHLTLHRRVSEKALHNAGVFKLIEAQAHRFAAAFCFPQEPFARESIPVDLDHFVSLKHRWKVSVKMMIHRTGELRLADPEVISTLYRRYSWRKWRTVEPLDKELPPELPRTLDKAATLVIEQGAVSDADLRHQIGLHEAEACRLAGMRRSTLAPTRAQVLQLRPTS